MSSAALMQGEAQECHFFLSAIVDVADDVHVEGLGIKNKPREGRVVPHDLDAGGSRGVISQCNRSRYTCRGRGSARTLGGRQSQLQPGDEHW